MFLSGLDYQDRLSMAHWPARLTPLDRFFGRFTRLRPGEGRSVAVFSVYALLMMVSYYILKTIREPLLLTGPSAEIKSYAYAVTALVLLLVVPVYGFVFRHTSKQQLTRLVTVFFLLNLGIFYLAGRAGIDIAFAYYVWVGVFAVMITAQFWAFAADSYNIRSGQRLFPVIMIGATLGGLLAPALSGALFPLIGPWVLMLVAMILLGLTVPFVGWSQAVVPPGSRSIVPVADETVDGGYLGGINLVLRDRYLLLLAIMILLLNWVNTTGEYILAELVVRQVDGLAGAGEQVVKADFIASFYGDFFFIVNLLTLLMQVLLVARIIRSIGVGHAVMILPLITLAGYGMLVFLPVFSLIQLVKVIENSTDYSLMNTTRHALYLPLTVAQKYEGKTTIEAFFWRFGDLAQAGAIYAGLNWLQFDIREFALMNVVLSVIWLGVAWRVSRHFRAREKAAGRYQRLEYLDADLYQLLQAGERFDFELPADAFTRVKPGDVLYFTIHAQDYNDLPGWLDFNAETLALSGIAPREPGLQTTVILRATGFDGRQVEGRLVLAVDGG